MNAKRNLQYIALAAGFLALAVLACSPPANDDAPSVQITSPVDGSTVTVGAATQIHATVIAGAGVTRVDLSVNGRVVDTVTPPSGNPTTFPFVQSWTPATAGDVAVMIVAYDTQGAASPPAVVRLVAMDGGDGLAPTSAPQPTDKPVDDVAGEGGCALNAGYVTDVTIPDNTTLGSGDGFVKTWRIRNSGTCDWGSGFKLVFVDGDHMGGPGSVTVNATAAGGTTDVSVNLAAPAAPGTYRSNWRMQADTGAFFGSTFYVQIVVPDSTTEEPTEVPTEDPTEEPLPDGWVANLRGQPRPDGRYRFTWDDAVGEARYYYSLTTSGGSVSMQYLPADTTSWTTGFAVRCDFEGSFTISARAEDGAEIGSETIEIELDSCPLPDLVVTHGTVTPDSVKKGQAVHVEVEVENVGEGPASGTFQVVWVGGTGCAWPVEGLEPGEKVTRSCDVNTPTTTTGHVIHNHTIVDADNSIVESNEDNNVLQLPPLSIIP